MKKTLLLDTNISSFPIYNYLINAGHFVYVIGSNPEDYLAKISPNYIDLDYRKISEVTALIESLEIEYIVPGCNDVSYACCVQLNANGKYTGLDSYEKSEIINNKEKFRIFATEHHLSIPKLLDRNSENIDHPIIIKPVDAYSGRGVTVIKKSEKEAVENAIQLAENFSTTKTCIIEEFVEGPLFSHSAFISSGKIMLDFIVEEHGSANPFAVDTSRVVYNFSSTLLEKIRAEILLMSDKLSLQDGLIHTQFIARDEQFWIIEITRRCPGDLYSQLIEISTDFKYAEMYAKPFVRVPMAIDNSELKSRFILRHTISQSEEIKFSSLEFKIPVQIERYFSLAKSGDLIAKSPFGRIGLLFLKCTSESEIKSLLSMTVKRGLYSIRD